MEDQEEEFTPATKELVKVRWRLEDIKIKQAVTLRSEMNTTSASVLCFQKTTEPMKGAVVSE